MFNITVIFLKIPNNCSHCNIEVGVDHRSYWIQRTELDYDSDVEDRIEDQIWECSACHTLFRLRWKLISFVELVEKGDK